MAVEKYCDFNYRGKVETIRERKDPGGIAQYTGTYYFGWYSNVLPIINRFIFSIDEILGEREKEEEILFCTIIYKGYDLECYPQSNNTYWGICRKLGIRVREDNLELLAKKFQEQVKKMEYQIYLSWICNQEDYYCTESEQFSVENLLESLPELVKRIEEIESKNTILNIQISRL